MKNKNQDDQPEYDPFKYYFQIDTEWMKKYMDQVIKKLNDVWNSDINSIDGLPIVSLPVNDYFSNTEGDKTSLYLGNNQYNEGIWKIKYFVYNKLQKEYELHLQSHASHIVRQPQYYQSLYEILN
jgi:hypothetical protein